MEDTKIYAIVEIAGKQYRVSPGETIDVDCLDKIEGETLEFDRVLLIGGDGATKVGKPVVKGAKIIATSQGTIRGDKVIVFRFKAKVRSRKKTGHHQLYTRLTIDKIEAPKGGRVKEGAASGT
ncbi:MAG TPA: 50S ribosomal protein L21 [Dehalococcoidales bacterium]